MYKSNVYVALDRTGGYTRDIIEKDWNQANPMLHAAENVCANLQLLTRW